MNDSASLVVDEATAVAQYPDAKVFGNPYDWICLNKFQSGDGTITKSTKVYDTGIGLIVQVSTKDNGHVAEALTFVPGVTLAPDGTDSETGKTIYKIVPANG